MRRPMAVVLVVLAASLAVFLTTFADERPASAAFPGENDRIAFGKYVQWGDRFRWYSQIFTMKPNGSDRHQLTNSEYDNYSPAWSPDGMKIAYDSPGDFGDEAWVLYTMNADGTDQHRIISGGRGVGREASWQPLP